MTTAVLQSLPLQLTASGALTVISSFCLHNGTDLKVCFPPALMDFYMFTYHVHG